MAIEVPVELSPARRDALTRRVRHLVGATIGYNTFEAVVSLSAGVAASSTALVGFGADSLIEVSSAAAVAWQFAARTDDGREARERTALRITAISFFALAVLVGADAIRSLLGASSAGPSRSRRPDRPHRVLVPRGLRRATRVVTFGARLEPDRSGGVPVHRPATALVHLAARPADVQGWGAIAEVLPDLAETATKRRYEPRTPTVSWTGGGMGF